MNPLHTRRIDLSACAATLGLFCAGAAFANACLWTTDSRVDRDDAVGHAEVGEARYAVVDGLAAIRLARANHVRLWASAPDIVLKAEIPEDEDRLTIEVGNGMPGAELTVLQGNVSKLERVDTDLATHGAFRLWGIAGQELALRFAPPDAEAAAPFEFALLSDVQEAIDYLSEIHHRINRETSVRFLLGAGDLTQRGTQEQLARYQAELRALNVPYYTTLGNHELGTDPPPFHDFFGRGSFHFVFKGVHFSLLDSGSATIDPRVYDWLDSWLAAGRNSVHVVAMHIPPIDPTGVRNGSFANRNEAAKLLERLAKAEVDLTLYGHVHSYYEFDNAGIMARISGGGGAIPETFDDVGRHFLIVHVDPASDEITTRRIDVDGG